jgi:hypothetical protein
MFDDHDYTEEAMIKQLGLIELHTKDGSALDAGCACIETKHLFNVEGLAEEMPSFTENENERHIYGHIKAEAKAHRQRIEKGDGDKSPEAYETIGEWARTTRKLIVESDFKPEKPKNLEKHFVLVEGNPHGHRLYLPHGLTEAEKGDVQLRHKLASCIELVEKREHCRPPYEGCKVNPVAVCRASIEG